MEAFKFLLRKDYSRSPRSLVVQNSRPAIERPGLESQRRVERDLFFHRNVEFLISLMIVILITDTFEMITENTDGGGYKFAVSYHFESNMRTTGEQSHPTRVKRLAQEAVTLSTALPLSYSSSVFVRCDADRLDVMKVKKRDYFNFILQL